MKCESLRKIVQICKDFIKRFKMASQKHAFVFLCKDSSGGGAIPAEFEKCCLTSLGCIADGMNNVGFSYTNGQLKVYPSVQGVRLQHAQGCPCRFLTSTDIANIPHETKSQGVVVAVSVVLQSSDSHVLLTRRAKHMRAFPGIWVPPGGHLEPEETLIQACLRELKEETGLHFSEDNLNMSTLGLWESVYPPVISAGLPRRHHIVVYQLAQVTEDHHALQTKLQLDKEELDAATWLDQNTVVDVVSSDDYGQTKKVPNRYFSASVIEDGQMATQNIPLSVLMATLPPAGTSTEIERLSTGSKFALSQWIKFLYSTPR